MLQENLSATFDDSSAKMNVDVTRKSFSNFRRFFCEDEF